MNIFDNIEGLSAANNVTEVLRSNDDTEVISQINLSQYLDTYELSDKLTEAKHKLSILSFNTQSIRAKFEEFQIAINRINSKKQ